MIYITAKSKEICVDFDGTIYVGAYPHIGKLIEENAEVLRALKEEGWKITVFTAREKDKRDKAEKRMKEDNVPYDKITNIKPPTASVFIDDRAIGVEKDKPWGEDILDRIDKVIKQHVEASVGDQSEKYWMSPDGEVYVVDTKWREHSQWILENRKIVDKYITVVSGELGDNSKNQTNLMKAGWIRLSRDRYGIYIHSDNDMDWGKIDDFILKYDVAKRRIILDYKRKEYEIQWGEYEQAGFSLGKFMKKVRASRSEFLGQGYWIDPNGIMYEIESTHGEWMADNIDKIEPYVEKDALKDFQDDPNVSDDVFYDLTSAGWIRVAVMSDEIVIESDNLNNFKVLDDILDHIKFKNIVMDRHGDEDVTITYKDWKYAGFSLEKALKKRVKSSYSAGELKDAFKEMVQNEEIKDYRGIGIYWAWSEETSYGYNDVSKDAIMLIGKIDQSQINLRETLLLNMTESEEMEIRLKPKAVVDIVGYRYQGNKVMFDTGFQVKANIWDEFLTIAEDPLFFRQWKSRYIDRTYNAEQEEEDAFKMAQEEFESENGRPMNKTEQKEWSAEYWKSVFDDKWQEHAPVLEVDGLEVYRFIDVKDPLKFIDDLKNGRMKYSVKQEISAGRFREAYWIDPSGKIYKVSDETDTHGLWIEQNFDLLSNYFGEDVINKMKQSVENFNYYGVMSTLVKAGWTRIRWWGGELNIECDVMNPEPILEAIKGMPEDLYGHIEYKGSDIPFDDMKQLRRIFRTKSYEERLVVASEDHWYGKAVISPDGEFIELSTHDEHIGLIDRSNNEKYRGDMTKAIQDGWTRIYRTVNTYLSGYKDSIGIQTDKDVDWIINQIPPEWFEGIDEVYLDNSKGWTWSNKIDIPEDKTVYDMIMARSHGSWWVSPEGKEYVSPLVHIEWIYSNRAIADKYLSKEDIESLDWGMDVDTEKVMKDFILAGWTQIRIWQKFNTVINVSSKCNWSAVEGLLKANINDSPGEQVEIMNMENGKVTNAEYGMVASFGLEDAVYHPDRLQQPDVEGSKKGMGYSKEAHQIAEDIKNKTLKFNWELFYKYVALVKGFKNYKAVTEDDDESRRELHTQIGYQLFEKNKKYFINMQIDPRESTEDLFTIWHGIAILLEEELGLRGSIATLVPVDQIYEYVQSIHGKPEDFETGTISERLAEYDEYQLVPDFKISNLDLNEWRVNKDYVNEIKEGLTPENVDPIVVTPSHSILDGIHRSNALHDNGYETIPAYVAVEKVEAKSTEAGMWVTPDDKIINVWAHTAWMYENADELSKYASPEEIELLKNEDEDTDEKVYKRMLEDGWFRVRESKQLGKYVQISYHGDYLGRLKSFVLENYSKGYLISLYNIAKRKEQAFDYGDFQLDKVEASNDVILYPAWWLAPGGKVYDVTEKDFTHAEWIINNLDIIENAHKGALRKLQNIFVEEDDQLIYEYMYSLGWARMRRYQANGIYLLINVPNIAMLREAQSVIDSRKIEFDRIGIAYQERTQVDVTKQVYEEEGFDLVKVQQKYKSGVYGKKKPTTVDDWYKFWKKIAEEEKSGDLIGRNDCVEYVPTSWVSKFHEYDRLGEHANKSPESLEGMKKAISEMGIVTPIYLNVNPVNQTCKIGEGNHRVMFAKMLGIETVPAWVLIDRYGKDTYNHYCPDIRSVKELMQFGSGEPYNVGEPYLPRDMKPSHVFKKITASKTEAMASPRDIDAYKTYYHGCSDDSKAERIMREGLKPAGITFNSRYEGDLESVKGMVYLTDSSDKAITYSFNAFNNSKYAWLFSIEGDMLNDIYPDEDVIGGILYEELKDRGERSNWLIDLAEENISEDDLIQFRHTHPNEVERMGAKFGKILLPLLTDEQMYELIDKGFAIAHKGEIMPSRVWKADKMKIMNYKDKHNVPLDAKLYFKYAKQVEMVEAKLDKYKIGLVAEEKKYGCLMVELPKDIADHIRNFAKTAIKDEDLYTEEEGFGREDEIHTTVLYGLEEKTGDKVLEAVTPVNIKLGNITRFSDDEKPYDVMIIEIESEDLHNLNEYVGDEFEHITTYKDYKPHITLAYVKKGACKDLDGKSGSIVLPEKSMGVEPDTKIRLGDFYYTNPKKERFDKTIDIESASMTSPTYDGSEDNNTKEEDYFHKGIDNVKNLIFDDDLVDALTDIATVGIGDHNSLEKKPLKRQYEGEENSILKDKKQKSKSNSIVDTIEDMDVDNWIKTW